MMLTRTLTLCTANPALQQQQQQQQQVQGGVVGLVRGRALQGRLVVVVPTTCANAGRQLCENLSLEVLDACFAHVCWSEAAVAAAAVWIGSRQWVMHVNQQQRLRCSKVSAMRVLVFDTCVTLQWVFFPSAAAAASS
jgi:hypothetical protein